MSTDKTRAEVWADMVETTAPGAAKELRHLPASEAALLGRIAAIAHFGGLVGLSSDEALGHIRTLTLGHARMAETLDETRRRVLRAIPRG